MSPKRPKEKKPKGVVFEDKDMQDHFIFIDKSLHSHQPVKHV